MIDYDKLSKIIIEYRRELHKIPELGFYVYKTSEFIRRVLSEMSCTVESIVKTGVIAYFDFGCESALAFRADMDGLPIEENTDAEYISLHDGCMHACGHDGHMAGLLGFAHVLDHYIREGIKMPYNVLLLFQPAEETIDGALKICATDVFSNYNVKAIYGLHLWPMFSKGEITSRPGAMMAKSTAVAVDFHGLSAHCGEPEKGKDALEAACAFITDIYRFKSLHIKERSILKFGKMESGNVRNAISAFTHLDGTMRTFDEKTWNSLTEAMNIIAANAQLEYGVKIDIDVSKSHPAVVNDEVLYRNIKPALSDLNFVELRRPVMVAEDFSFFEEQLPGIFFFLGTGSGIPLHSDNYDFDDTVLIYGVKLFDTILKAH